SAIAGLVRAPRHGDGVSAATAATPTTTAPTTSPTPATPLTPAPGATGRPLAQSAVYTSRHGVLNFTLVASQQAVMIARRRIPAKGYNGSFAAPTLVAAPGDLVKVKLVNHLDEPTNLH